MWLVGPNNPLFCGSLHCMPCGCEGSARRGERVSVLEEAIPQHMQDYYRYVMKGLLARDSWACAKLFAEVIAETKQFYGHLVPTSFA